MPVVDEETLKAEQKAQEEISEFVMKIMEKYELSPASIKVILYDIADNINPYVSYEELTEEE